MAWRITVRRIDGTPLGDLPTVRRRIEAILPSIQFYQAVSGAEKIAAAREAGVEFPDVVRQALEKCPAVLQADYEGDGFFLRLYGFERLPLDSIEVEIRGSGNPMPTLAALCLPNKWVSVDGVDGRLLELTGEAIGWEAFQKYRDHAIRTIKERIAEEVSDDSERGDHDRASISE